MKRRPWALAPTAVLVPRPGPCSDHPRPTVPTDDGGTDPPPAGWERWEQEIQCDGATYHLDPVGGDLDNPGTEAAPWPGLDAVLAADLIQRWEPENHPYTDDAFLVLVNPDAPVQPGDRLLLHDGDHGHCTLMDAHNPDYLLIAAAPGAAPRLQRLELIGVERLVVDGLTIAGERSDDLGGTLLAITSHNWRGPCRYVSVRNCYDVNENHDDGFQSFSVNGQPPRERVVLRGNIIIGYSDPDQPLRGTLQGIGCFDGFYIDWVIENNLVVTDHWHGITLLGARGCRVVNNTVVDLNDTRPGPPWIMITDHKDGRPSEDCLIRNNIARTISAGDGVSADHNLETTDLAAVFEDPDGGDWRPLAGGPAVDAGTTDLAPSTDLNGQARPQGAGVDLGALER